MSSGPNAFLDINGEVCPMTYVRTKLKLEELVPGAVLEIKLKGDEPKRNIPRSAVEDGHRVVSLEPLSDGTWKLLLKKEERGPDAHR